jgi:ABC-type transporter Mla subunit MlaD
MGSLIEGLEAQRRQLDDSLSSLAALINTAASGFPEIETKITEMVQQVGDGVRAANDEFRATLLASVNQMSRQVGENITATNNELKTALVNAAK